MSPGNSVAVPRSMRRAPAGRSAAPRSPTETMRSARTTTATLRRGAAPVPSIIVAAVMTVTASGAAGCAAKACAHGARLESNSRALPFNPKALAGMATPRCVFVRGAQNTSSCVKIRRMDKQPDWRDLGAVADLVKTPVQELQVGGKRIALSFHDGQFGAIHGVCNHVGGPLGQGRLDGDYVVCPWHNYKYHWRDGRGEPGYEDEAVPSYQLKTDAGRLSIDLNSATPRRP